MVPTIRNIIIFVVIAVVITSGYFFFFKPNKEQSALVSSTPSVTSTVTTTTNSGVMPIPTSKNLLPRDFLSLLLNVKNIKLNDKILSDDAFSNLRDSSITLTQDGTEGRANPFAPIGVDATPKTTTATTPATPPAITTPPPKTPPASMPGANRP